MSEMNFGSFAQAAPGVFTNTLKRDFAWRVLPPWVDKDDPILNDLRRQFALRPEDLTTQPRWILFRLTGGWTVIGFACRTARLALLGSEPVEPYLFDKVGRPLESYNFLWIPTESLRGFVFPLDETQFASVFSYYLEFWEDARPSFTRVVDAEVKVRLVPAPLSVLDCKPVQPDGALVVASPDKAQDYWYFAHRAESSAIGLFFSRAEDLTDEPARLTHVIAKNASKISVERRVPPAKVEDPSTFRPEPLTDSDSTQKTDIPKEPHSPLKAQVSEVISEVSSFWGFNKKTTPREEEIRRGGQEDMLQDPFPESKRPRPVAPVRSTFFSDNPNFKPKKPKP